MSNIIYEYQNEEGETIRIQAETPQTERTRGGTRDTAAITKKIQIKFEEALGTVKAATTGLKRVMDEVSPDEVSIEFSLKAEGETGFFTICRAATSAEFKITLSWKNEKT